MLSSQQCSRVSSSQFGPVLRLLPLEALPFNRSFLIHQAEQVRCQGSDLSVDAAAGCSYMFSTKRERIGIRWTGPSPHPGIVSRRGRQTIVAELELSVNRALVHFHLVDWLQQFDHSSRVDQDSSQTRTC